jgi:hypothetical protein
MGSNLAKRRVKEMRVSRGLLLIAHSTRPTQKEGAIYQQLRLATPTILAPSTPPRAYGVVLHKATTAITCNPRGRQYPTLASLFKESHPAGRNFLYGT